MFLSSSEGGAEGGRRTSDDIISGTVRQGGRRNVTLKIQHHLVCVGGGVGTESTTQVSFCFNPFGKMWVK